jgi:hypothetical protein
MYFVVMPIVNLIVILMTYVRYLYSINCPTVIFYPACCYLSYGETPLVNCGPQSNFLYIPIPFYFYSHYLLLLAYYYPFTTRYAQSFVYSKPVRLTTCRGDDYVVHHGPSNMAVDIPGVPTALAREDRLCPKGRLC